MDLLKRSLFFIILLNLLCFLYELNYANSYFSYIFGLNMLFFIKHYYFQSLSSMFLHANWTHLGFNMIMLFQFGLLLERILGTFNFLIFYLLGGILTSLLSLPYIYFFDQNANIIGASGAICVLMGFYSRLDSSAFKGLLIAILLMSFLPLIMGIKVAWFAHIIGFFLGYILAYFLKV